MEWIPLLPNKLPVFQIMTRPLTILLLCLAACGTSASAQESSSALKQFEGKTLILRHSLQRDSQKYDAQGNVLTKAEEGSCTVYGGVLIDHIAVTQETLRVEGRRIFFLFSDNGLILYELHKLKGERKPPISTNVVVEIKLEHPMDSDQQAQSILEKVFALNTKDLLHILPEVWRDYIKNHLVSYDASQKSDAEFHWRKQRGARSEAVVDAKPYPNSDDEVPDTDKPIFHIGEDDNVKPPQAKFTPAPDYPAIAQYEKYQGIVVLSIIVGKDGKVYRPHLLRPLGMGLDEIALVRVQTWRFQPSTHKGEPAVVEMNVEVAFNLD
jgi:TonB family protein